jgi:hypothetical protein
VTFVNLDMAHDNKNMSYDMKQMDCSVPTWQDVKMATQ